MPPNAPSALRARYLFPVAGPPIAGGMLTIESTRIVAVGEYLASIAAHDLGNVAIVPGLINTHTHLEFSHLEQPLGTPGIPFPDWIREIISLRIAAGDSANDVATDATEKGLAESIEYGTTSLGEITKPDWPADLYTASPIDTTVFLELLGLAEERRDGLLALAHEHISSQQEAEGFRRGITPHATYTISADVLASVAQHSAERHFPVAFHLAESPEEMELLAAGTGPLVELLAYIDAWHPSMIRRGTRPLDYLKILASAHRALAIHGNYLNGAEIEFAAQHADRLSIIYCPRTHAYFQHDHYPLAEMLTRGASVALGTDSRASSPDLSLFAEMQFVADNHTGISPADVLSLGTLAGARALGIDRCAGALKPGRRADLTVIELPERGAADPHELLFDPAARVIATMIGGEFVFGP